MNPSFSSVPRRNFLGMSAATLAAAAVCQGNASAVATSAAPVLDATVAPPAGKRILLSCKLGMIATEVEGKKLSLTERLKMAGQAGFDGVDFDEAGNFTVEQARAAVLESGVFCHNAINHQHWEFRLTSAKQSDREKGVANIEHCLRVSHAIGGSAWPLRSGNRSYSKMYGTSCITITTFRLNKPPIDLFDLLTASIALGLVCTTTLEITGNMGNRGNG
jgi:L-ribulose-5-phosphate 3-epimerase